MTILFSYIENYKMKTQANFEKNFSLKWWLYKQLGTLNWKLNLKLKWIIEIVNSIKAIMKINFSRKIIQIEKQLCAL